MPPGTNGWNEWAKHVLQTGERHEERLEEIRKEMTRIRIEIGMLKIKAGIWGVLGGAIPVAIALGVWAIKS
tara:strand:- start:207 stop:419 length:213 start_codon:yes stop_codon:yes gene_type:complete